MASVKPLAGKVCIVTGATRGIGKGIALQLGVAGATVYITGRTLKRREGDPIGGSLEETAEEITKRGGTCVSVHCDHSNDEDIKALFDRVDREQEGQLDLLVNNAYSGVKAIADSFKKPFWEQPPEIWDDINTVGLRNHYICSVLAARMMVPRKQGLIVTVSSAGGLTYLFNVAYGIGKEGCDRMAADCGKELRKHNVAFVSLWPGLVRTETVKEYLSKNTYGDSPDVKLLESSIDSAESPEYSGLAVVKLASDPDIMKKSGRILITADLGREYGFVDVNGDRHASMRELGYALTLYTHNPIYVKMLPSFIRIPCFLLSLLGNKF